jgi:hypothetical protein
MKGMTCNLWKEMIINIKGGALADKMLSKKLTKVHGLLYFEFCSVVDEKIVSSLLTLLLGFPRLLLHWDSKSRNVKVDNKMFKVEACLKMMKILRAFLN